MQIYTDMSRGANNSRGAPRGGGGFSQSQRGNRGNGGRGRGIVNQRPDYQKPTITDSQAWKGWPEVKVKVVGYPYGLGLPPDMFAGDVWDVLSKYGNLVKVDVWPAKSEMQPRIAMILFNPPPREAFWQREKIDLPNRPGWWFKAELQDQSEMAQKSVKFRQIYENTATCPISRLGFGYMHQPGRLAIKRTVTAGPDPHAMRMTVNIDRREVTIYFAVDNVNLEEDAEGLPTADYDRASNSSGETNDSGLHEFKFQIPFKQLHHIGFRNTYEKNVELFISLPTTSVPRFFKKMDPATTFEQGETYWTENKAWHRRTAICSNAYGRYQRSTPLSLNEPQPFIDISAWTTYQICIDQNTFTFGNGLQVQQMLAAYNIAFDDQYDVQVSTCGPRDPATSATPFWNAVDHDHNPNSGHASILMNLESNAYLPFNVRYQLEACVSKNLLNPSNMSADFLAKLSTLNEKKAVKLLEHVADKGNRVFDPMTIFSMRPPRTSSTRKVHSNHILQRSITIKPSSMEFLTPSVDETNRIIRQFDKWPDRFIRVNFRDEKGEGKIFSSDDETSDPLFNRVKRCLNNGIRIGDRHYVWLASGNSQFREHGAYFFAEIPGVVTAQDIRARMGDFSEMHYVAKFNARMGQCFSTTREYDGVPLVDNIPDVEIINGNATICFTDGVGMISGFLSQLINTRMKFSKQPTAYQFRYGGAKGVLVVNKQMSGLRIAIRPSQAKFGKGRERLEIIKPAAFVHAELNRQLITILTSLGIDKSVFLTKLDNMLKNINDAMNDTEKAKDMLRKRTDINSMTLTIRDMVKHGFMREDDPFVRSILLLWRAWSHKKLKEKAGIQIDDGAFVMGVTDEMKTLKGHFNYRAQPRMTPKEKIESLPQIFLQVWDKEDCNRARESDHADYKILLSDQKDPNKPRVITGVCILARNPSLHPGDIRVVNAVDVEALHHLTNVVVFPQTGDVDIPSMCSGGDLDGDDYFVSWDPELIPPHREWNHPPMHHITATPQWVPTVSAEDVKKFFVNHMKQDSLGRIANSWLAQADQLDDGPKDFKCKQLASLHSTAVDFPKSGVPASMKILKQLQPRQYPHYLESNRPAHKIYHSPSVVGKLYDKVQRIEYQPMLHLPFDSRVLNAAYERDVELEKDIQVIKNDYDAALRRIMAQFEVESEAEIWTGFIMQHGKGLKEYELQSKIGSLVNQQKDKFREVCIARAGSRESHQLYPIVTAMYRVTAKQVKSELRQIMDVFQYESETVPQMAPQERPMMSFPWIFHYELGRIARHHQAKALPRADAELLSTQTRDVDSLQDSLQNLSLTDVNKDADDRGGAASFLNGESVNGLTGKHLPVAGFLDFSRSPKETENIQQQPTTGTDQASLSIGDILNGRIADTNHHESSARVDYPAPAMDDNNKDFNAALFDDFASLNFNMTSSHEASFPGTTAMHPSPNVDMSSSHYQTLSQQPETNRQADGVVDTTFGNCTDHPQVGTLNPPEVVNGHSKIPQLASGHSPTSSETSNKVQYDLASSDTDSDDDDEELEQDEVDQPRSAFSRLASFAEDDD